MPVVISNTAVPLNIFAILSLLIATILFVLAAVLPISASANASRERLVAAGLACWVLFILLQLIGGLVKTP